MTCKDILKAIDIRCNKCFNRFVGACKPEQSGEICLTHWLELLAVYMIVGGEY